MPRRWKEAEVSHVLLRILVVVDVIVLINVVVVVVVIIIVVILGLDILCCGHRHLSRCAVSSLSLCHRLYRHAAATIAAPTPVSLRLSRVSGWLLHRHLSRCTSASLVVPRCSATSLVAPPPLSLWRLTCAGWLSLRQLS